VFLLSVFIIVCHLNDAVVSLYRHELDSFLTVVPSSAELHTDNIVMLPANESEAETTIYGKNITYTLYNNVSLLFGGLTGHLSVSFACIELHFCMQSNGPARMIHIQCMWRSQKAVRPYIEYATCHMLCKCIRCNETLHRNTLI